MNLSPKRITQLCRVVTGKTPPTSRQEFFGGEYLFVTPSDLDYCHYYCRKTERTVSEEARSLLPNQFVPADSVMFTCIGATIGKCGIAPAECLTNQQINSVIANDHTNAKFLYYLLCHNIDVVKGLGGGSATPIVSKSKFEEIEFLVPSFKEQQAIAEILSAYDDLIENNRRRMALLEETARQLYREWFVRLRFPGHEHTRITNGVPEGWARRRIGDIAECVGGGTPSTTVSAYWEDGDVMWVTPTDVTRNKHLVLLDSEKKITEGGLQNSSARLVPSHAVLMTSRASVGFFAVAGREVCTNQGFISVVPHESSLSPFLLFHLSERVEEIRAMGSGSTYPEVSRGKFREFEVLLPRATLASAFDEQATQLLKQIRILKQQGQKLRTARDLLLPRLMSGEITV